MTAYSKEHMRRTVCILITNDKDFGELIYRGKKLHRGVILLRLEDERADNKKSKSLSIHLTLSINNILYHFNTLVVIEKNRIRKKRRIEKNERANGGCGYESERGPNQYFPNRQSVVLQVFLRRPGDIHGVCGLLQP